MGQLTPRVGLRLTNPTCAALTVERVGSPSWIDAKGLIGQKLEPGGTKEVLAKSRTFKEKKPDFGEIRLGTSIGEVSLLMMLNPEQPVLETAPERVQYWSDQQPLPRDWQFGVFPQAGKIRIIGVGNPSESWLTVKGSPSEPVVVSREEPLIITARLEPEKASQSALADLRRASLKTIFSNVPIIYEGPHGPAETNLKVTIDLRQPPVLNFSVTDEQSHPRTCNQTAGQELSFKVTNASETDELGAMQNAVLEILAVAVTPPVLYPNAAGQVLSPLPIKLLGGQSAEIRFQFNLLPLPPNHPYKFILRITTNRQTEPEIRELTLNVRAVEPFRGVVAIDFGSSNTCCAVLPIGGDVETVKLDEERTTVPTLVSYVDLSGPVPVVETGAAVKQYAAIDERHASSTLSGLKQQLGVASHPLLVRPKKSNDWVTREAREAAADYLMLIRGVAERQRGTTFHEFILTHPAVCSLDQYKNLRSALDAAFGAGNRVHFLQEPVASLVPFFDKESRKEKATPDGYTVAAFDLGGGTTDITLVHVVHSRAGDILEIRPEILASWGERFGGEDITNFLVSEVRERCSLILQAKQSNYRIAGAAMPDSSTAGIRRNESALRGWAENFKAGLSQEEKREKSSDRLLLNIVPLDHSQLPEDYSFAVTEIFQSGGNLPTVLTRFVEDQIDRLASRLAETAESVPQLDFIQMSGKTSYLPIVGEVLRRKFPKSRIERAPDPKECVVRGACLWKAFSAGRNRRLILPSSSQRTTSQIGIVNEDNIFRPLIRADQPVLPGGLVVDTANFWDGQEPVLLWENLGVNNQSLLPDGSRNPLISRLGLWVPVAAPAGDGRWWTLRLTLSAQFDLSISAFRESGHVEFERVSIRGGVN